MSRRKKEDDPRTEHERQRDFLTAWADTFNLAEAAQIARVSVSNHCRWYRKNAKYALAFEKRKEIAGQYLDAIAIGRAADGWLEPVYYQGNVCGEVRRFDSGLLQFLLRGMLPEKYGARQEISGPQGAPIQAKIEVVFVRPDDTSGSGNQGELS